MQYLDSNVFVRASLDQGDMGDKVRSLLEEVQRGELVAATSALTFDELIWAIKKQRSADDAVAAGEAFLKTPGLKIRGVDGALLPYVLEIIKRYHLDPPGFNSRRFSHPRRRGEIVSTDIHFGKAEGLQRRSFTQVRDKKQSND